MAGNNSAAADSGEMFSPIEATRVATSTPRVHDGAERAQPRGSENVSYIELGVQRTAGVAGGLAAVEGTPEVIAAVTEETPVAFMSKSESLAAAHREQGTLAERLDRAGAVLDPLRQHISRMRRVIAASLVVVFMVGDTTLNASAALASQDESILLAVFEFLSISAGTVGIGWWTGTSLAELYHAGRAGEPTTEAKDAHFGRFFHRPGDIWRVARLIAVLVVTAAGCAIAVAILRFAAGDSWVYGLFSAMVSVGAAALMASTHDAPGQFLDGLQRRLDAVGKRIDVITSTMDAHIAAVRTTDLVAEQVEHRIDTAQGAVIATGDFGIGTNPSEHHPYTTVNADGSRSVPTEKISVGPRNGGQFRTGLADLTGSLDERLAKAAQAGRDAERTYPVGRPAAGPITKVMPVETIPAPVNGQHNGAEGSLVR